MSYSQFKKFFSDRNPYLAAKVLRRALKAKAMENFVNKIQPLYGQLHKLQLAVLKSVAS